MIHQDKRRAFHKGMVAGKAPAEIAQEHGVDELDVVQTLRHPKPKIAGANYCHLKIPVPMDEIIDAFYEDSLDTLGELYGVGVATLRLRLPKELRDTIKRGRKAKTKPKPSDALTQAEKDEVVNRWYRSGRKLNACGVTSQIARAVLTDQGIVHKKSDPIPPKDVVALLDCLLEKTAQGIIGPKAMFVWSRKLHEFKTNNPHVWKGQMLDWLLDRENIVGYSKIIPHINEAIEQVIKLRGYEDVDS